MDLKLLCKIQDSVLDAEDMPAKLTEVEQEILFKATENNIEGITTKVSSNGINVKHNGNLIIKVSVGEEVESIITDELNIAKKLYPEGRMKTIKGSPAYVPVKPIDPENLR